MYHNNNNDNLMVKYKCNLHEYHFYQNYELNLLIFYQWSQFSFNFIVSFIFCFT